MAKPHGHEQTEPAPVNKESLKRGHEITDVSLRSIAIAGAILIVGGLVTQVICWYCMTGLHGIVPKAAPRSALYDAKAGAPTPQLQGTPNHAQMDRRDMFLLRQQEQERLNSYGWVDRDKGIVQIPIDRAMQLAVRNLANPRPATQPAASALMPSVVTGTQEQP